MYLSVFTFNPARRGAQKLLGSPHALHAAVLAGFADPTPTADGRVLWRLDNDRHAPKLVVTSPTAPDLTHLAEQAGRPTLEDCWRVREYTPFLAKIANGQRYRFRLTANPVHAVRERDGERGKPRGHLTVAQQEKWLRDRAEPSGFSFAPADGGSDAMLVTDRRLVTFRRREIEVVLRIASYEGTLVVRDGESLVATLTHGLGRAKGYGCGLLTLAPAAG